MTGIFKIKKKTIFRMFIIPLGIVMLAQAILSFGAIWLGGTSAHLKDYSAGIMEQIVKNRNLIISNSMIHRWSNITGEAQTANSVLERLLEESRVKETEFLQNKEIKDQLLSELLLPCVTMLRKNGVNGAYIILADGVQAEGNLEDVSGKQKCSGIYFRDSDAYINPRDYSDLLMVRGDYKYSHQLNIPFDSIWSGKFSFEPSGALASDNFFYKPYNAALENKGVKAENLGYWGKLFYLEDARSGYPMISYSIPLITEKGYVYGVIGIELSVSALDVLLPELELNGGEQSGYILAEYDSGTGLVPFYVKGAAVKRNVELGKSLLLSETKYPNLYRIEDAKENRQNFYADIQPFNMYNSNTPFENSGWALVGVQDDQGLFGMGERIVQNVLSVIITSLVVGFFCIYFLTNHLTRPISELAAWIRNAKRSRVGEYEKTNIIEVDDLYKAVHEMTEKQRKAEYEALEEKERYLMALQSSTDIIYTYNLESDSMDILNLLQNGKNELTITKVCKRIMRSGDILDSDQQQIQHIFSNPVGSFKHQFRYRTREHGWQWFEMAGKTISDESGNKVKIIGNIRNIHEQKISAQRKNRATRIDGVTGLYREDIGHQTISGEIQTGKKGCLAFLDLDKFKELNEQYGIDFGDAVLEELGRYILKLKSRLEISPKKIVAIRAGGDEILIWMRDFSKDEVKSFFDSFYRMAAQLHQNGRFDFSVTSVAMFCGEEDRSYKELQHCLLAAMLYCKRRLSGGLTFYSDIPEEELQCENEEMRSFNEIASMGNPRKVNVVTKAFNLFERGNKVMPVISVLFAKLGEIYRAKMLLMTEIRWDFNTSLVICRWNESEDRPPKDEIVHFKEEDLLNCSKKLTGGSVCFGDKEIFTEQERRILHIPSDSGGLCIPLYDNRKLMGTLLFVRCEDQAAWNEEECGELQEITRIIETNLNRERYDQASRAKSDFLSRMSHEIRTPMNAIIGMADIALGRQEEPEKVEDCLHKISQSSQYLLGLINDILDMSKIESGKMKLALSEGNILEFAGEVSDLTQAQFENKNIHYVQNIHVKREWMRADFMRLKQVIINLTGNAVKFTPADGTVTLTIEEKSAPQDEKIELYVAVSDTGIGISRENQERIFDAFEQAENMTASVYGGTGLGLSISSRLVRLMGSDICLDSVEGHGSRFYFTIKLEPAQQEYKEEKLMAAMENQDFTGTTVLLVEDNELNTEIAKALLEMYGCCVETAVNGLEGMEKFRHSEVNYYDLILMDIRMPVMDGLEATKAIRRMDKKDAQTIPIIAMTANAFDEDMRRSIESGMNGHLAKPVDVKEFLRVAGAAMGGGNTIVYKDI